MITLEQIRAARALKGWSQEELARRAGVTQVTVANIELGNSRGSPKSMRAITRSFENSGVEFIEGGVRLNKNFINFFDTPDSYLRVLDDVYFTLMGTGGEVLFSGSDERKSTPEVNEALSRIRDAGIRMRSIVEEGNFFLLGPLEEYRQMPRQYMSDDVRVIYEDKVAFLTQVHPHAKVMLVQNEYISRDLKRNFNYMWDMLPQPDRTEAKLAYGS